jgi:hypothetical protein
MGGISQVQVLTALSSRPRGPSRARTACAVILGMLVFSGCATTHATRKATYAPVALAQPKSEIAESELLGVRIIPFEPGDIPEKEKGLSKQIRAAESYYAAVQLKTAMQESGYWGPVRVVPADVTGGEVVVSGRIVESDGEVLKLAVRARDATGAAWLDKQYAEVIDVKHYDDVGHGGEPFKFLYVRIANDLAEVRERLSPRDTASIRQVAELRFAEDLAPEAFKGYLETGDPSRTAPASQKRSARTDQPTLRVARLPANDDPVFASIKRIRITEEGVIDTFDLQHENLAKKISDPYTQWRIARLKEMNAVRQLEAKRNTEVGKAVALGVGGLLLGTALGVATGGTCPSCLSLAGVAVGATSTVALRWALDAVKQSQDETQIHRAALEESGESLSQELKVTVVQVEGDTRQLKGTADEQFAQWRTLLKEMHERDVGVPQTKQ